jgi:hypothetical protein
MFHILLAIVYYISVTVSRTSSYLSRMAAKINEQPSPAYNNPNESNANTSNIESYQYLSAQPPPYYSLNESNANASNIGSYQFPAQPMGQPIGMIRTIQVPAGTPICPLCQVIIHHKTNQTTDFSRSVGRSAPTFYCSPMSSSGRWCSSRSASSIFFSFRRANCVTVPIVVTSWCRHRTISPIVDESTFWFWSAYVSISWQ